MKARTVFYCTECGNETPKWAGKCPACGAWNTVVERPPEAAPKKSRGLGRAASAMPAAVGGSRRARPVTDLETAAEIRFPTGMGELDRVLGGGAVKGSLVLVGGAPGIGKSTLMLQICSKLCEFSKVLYVSVYITKLRKHLKEDDSIEIINIHGKGYKLITPEVE